MQRWWRCASTRTAVARCRASAGVGGTSALGSVVAAAGWVEGGISRLLWGEGRRLCLEGWERRRVGVGEGRRSLLALLEWAGGECIVEKSQLGRDLVLHQVALGDRMMC
jgi:hypothetical protein